MAYQATILNVMIASPSDVTEERLLVRDAIYEWNAIHSKQFGIMLNPIGWETHVAPEMGNRPQEIINKRILNDADILIGIFWTRLGTETGEYVSGTVEEIEKHISSQKLASIYVCDKPIPPSQITDQYQKLQVKIKEWKPNGVIQFYKDTIGFKQTVKDHLSLHIQDNEYIQSLLNKLSVNTDTTINNSTPQAIELNSEMTKILSEAGQSEDEIQIQESIDNPQLHVGRLHINLDTSRKKSTWLAAITELEKHGLIVNKYDGILFELTQAGWQAFDQLKAQTSEKD